ENLHGNKLAEFSKTNGGDEWLNTFFDSVFVMLDLHPNDWLVSLVRDVPFVYGQYSLCVSHGNHNHNNLH
ncbi:unnamed protein product, partial [marine sediment metagenome]